MKCQTAVEVDLAQLRLERDRFFQDGSVAAQIYVRAKEIYHHEDFASWYTKAFTRTEKPKLGQVMTMKEILYKHAPKLRFVDVETYNITHPGRPNVEADVFGFCPRDVSGEEHDLVFNNKWFPTGLDLPGYRTDLQRDMFVAIGIVTFLHELAHFCIGHTDAESPLTASARTPSGPTQMGTVVSEREPMDYEYDPTRNNREAGFRLEEHVFGGRPALSNSRSPMLPEGFTLDVHDGERVFACPFGEWTEILGDVGTFFAKYPRPAVIPSDSDEVTPGHAPMSVRCSCGGLEAGRRMPIAAPLPAHYVGGSKGRQRYVLVRPSDYSQPAQE